MTGNRNTFAYRETLNQVQGDITHSHINPNRYATKIPLKNLLKFCYLRAVL